MHAEACPVCNGRGTIKDDSDIAVITGVQCHGCHGKGWVEVRDESRVSYLEILRQLNKRRRSKVY